MLTQGGMSVGCPIPDMGVPEPNRPKGPETPVVTGGPPPYLLVLDVGRTLRVWDRRSGGYGGFQGAVRTVDLARLAERPDDVAFLRAVWEDLSSLDPNLKSAAVTKEIAGKLAVLATRLEAGGHDQERVARFLIRCVFTMFAEDVGLLDGVPFERAVELGLEDRPGEFNDAVAELWAAWTRVAGSGAVSCSASTATSSRTATSSPSSATTWPSSYDETTIRTIKQIDVLRLKGRAIQRALLRPSTTTSYAWPTCWHSSRTWTSGSELQNVYLIREPARAGGRGKDHQPQEVPGPVQGRPRRPQEEVAP
jgi:hypothetical protein